MLAGNDIKVLRVKIFNVFAHNTLKELCLYLKIIKFNKISFLLPPFLLPKRNLPRIFITFPLG